MKADILIKNATIVTMNANRESIEDGAIVINNGRIIAIGKTSEIMKEYNEIAKVYDATGKAVFPGLINNHVHSFQTLLKGLGDDKVLIDWLMHMTSPSLIKLEHQDMYYAAALSGLDAIRSGTTTILDYQYAHPKAGFSEKVIEGYQTTGIRLLYGRSFADTGADRGWCEKGELESIETIEADVRSLCERYQGKSDGMVEIWLAPSAVWLCTKECLLMMKSLSEELGLRMTAHMSETMFDREASTELHGFTDIGICEELGFLNEKFLMVHCVYLDAEDQALAKKRGAMVSYAPISNMYLASGTAPIPAMRKLGINCGLATDGAGSNNTNDMLECLKFGTLLQKVNASDPLIMTAMDILEMATIEGAKTVGLENELGSLEIGKKADLFIFNPMLSPKSVPMHRAISALVYASSPINIETVIVNGKIVLEDGNFLNLDESKMLKAANDAAIELSKRAGTGKYRK